MAAPEEPMRTTVILALLACGVLARAAAPPNPPSQTDEALREELLEALRREGAKADSARVALDYWWQCPMRCWGARKPTRKRIRTVDGKAAEVIVLDAPSSGLPGMGFAVAFLRVDGRVVDSASCWSFSQQDVLLEDVDQDGCLDLAFRAPSGVGLAYRPLYTRPNDKREWLDAYAITSAGFRSLFPQTARTITLQVKCDTRGLPVRLRVEAPRSAREDEFFRCRVSVTNASRKDLTIEPGSWFRLDEAAICGPVDPRVTLRPGETVSQDVRMMFFRGKGAGETVTLRCVFSEGSAKLSGGME
jgi:hypothetical protein